MKRLAVLGGLAALTACNPLNNKIGEAANIQAHFLTNNPYTLTINQKDVSFSVLSYSRHSLSDSLFMYRVDGTEVSIDANGDVSAFDGGIRVTNQAALDMAKKFGMIALENYLLRGRTAQSNINYNAYRYATKDEKEAAKRLMRKLGPNAEDNFKKSGEMAR